MDSTLNPTLEPVASPRLAAVRDVRSWRAGQWLPARVATLVVPIAAFLAWCFLALNTAQARVQIDFDPMRPPAAAVPAETAASGPTDVAPAAPALPTLKITRQIGSGGAALSALVDDTWVRRGDVVAGYRVTALRTESIDLVSVADPGLRLTLRLNPVTVERSEVSPPVASLPPPGGTVRLGAAQRRTEASKAPLVWPALALEKK